MKRFGILVGLLALSASTACVGGGIGDPCIPEAIPEGGFVRAENFLETSSVGCRTRVCLVYSLAGDPRYVTSPLPEVDTCPTGLPPGADPGDVMCPTAEEVENKVFCTERCESNAECPGGFICRLILDIGGEGIRGSYCVRHSALEPEELGLLTDEERDALNN